jgi:hypothetical protein
MEEVLQGAPPFSSLLFFFSWTLFNKNVIGCRRRVMRVSIACLYLLGLHKY